MREVGDAEQQVAQPRRQVVVFGGQRPFLVTEFSALGLQPLGGLDVAVAPELSDLLGDRVHPCSDGVAPTGDVEDSGVESCGLVDLVEQ